MKEEPIFLLRKAGYPITMNTIKRSNWTLKVNYMSSSAQYAFALYLNKIQ